jgi:predicted peroxiredoxin
MQDPERVTAAFLAAVGAAEQGRPTLMFLTKGAAGRPWRRCDRRRLQWLSGVADLVARYVKAGATTGLFHLLRRS